MNGLLTALLGGAAGLGQGVEANREFALRQNQQNLDRAKLVADLYLQGLQLDDDQPPSNGGQSSPAPGMRSPAIAPTISPTISPAMPRTLNPPAVPLQSPPTQSPPAPQGLLTGLLNGTTRMKDGVMGPPPSMTSRGPSASLPGTDAAPQLSAPGSVRAIDVVRDVANGAPASRSSAAASPAPDVPPMIQHLQSMDGQTVSLPGLGNFRFNFARSPAARELALHSYEAYANKSAENQALLELADTKAQAAVAAGQPDPRTGQPITYRDAFNAALNGNLAWQAPVEGSPAKLAATGADRTQQELVDLDALIRGGPVRARNAALETDATTPGFAARAGAVAAATAGANPPEAQLRAAGALQSALHAKQVIDQYVQQFGAPGVRTQLAQRYPTLGNYLDSKEGQTLRNAAINFLDASMDASGQQRYNGAVLAQKLQGIIPWAGDTPDVLNQKLSFMNDALQSMAVNAGAAMPRAGTPNAGTPSPMLPGAQRNRARSTAASPIWTKYGITPSAP